MKKPKSLTNPMNQRGNWALEELFFALMALGVILSGSYEGSSAPKSQIAIFLLKVFTPIMASLLGVLIAMAVSGKL